MVLHKHKNIKDFVQLIKRTSKMIEPIQKAFEKLDMHRQSNKGILRQDF